MKEGQHRTCSCSSGVLNFWVQGGLLDLAWCKAIILQSQWIWCCIDWCSKMCWNISFLLKLLARKRCIRWQESFILAILVLILVIKLRCIESPKYYNLMCSINTKKLPFIRILIYWVSTLSQINLKDCSVFLTLSGAWN